MSINRRLIQVQYDTSNKSYQVFVAMIHKYDGEDNIAEMWHSAFTTIGGALAFFAAWMVGDWKRESIDGHDCWVGDLRTDFPGGGYQVSVRELLLVTK